MDRRKIKTVRAIKDAFCRLIKQKPYSDISIQNVIDEAEIARATFYAHFSNKEEILVSISKGIFAHVTDAALRAEHSHDFSADHDFKHKIIHLFYHLGDYNDVIFGILSSESREIFLNDLKAHLDDLFLDCPRPTEFDKVPADLFLNHVTTALMETILWWITKNQCHFTPEEMADYYFMLVGFAK